MLGLMRQQVGEAGGGEVAVPPSVAVPCLAHDAASAFWMAASTCFTYWTGILPTP